MRDYQTGRKKEKAADHDQVVIVDLDTMEKTLLVDKWFEAFYAVDGIGYYLDIDEGHLWHYVNLASGETGMMN